jgi:phosphatidylserine/phosphatidylglycerophosphate/cardiolipin synthase-like enzyme
VVPVSSITTGATVATCFAPEENCSAFATDAIDGAEREIRVSAYSLTTGSGISEVLVRAAERGVAVRLIADRTTPCERKTGMDLIAQAGASVWIDHGVRIAHSKTMVIDGKVTSHWSAR